ncbi:MAG: S8 family serine peptidase, partial [Ilumatobacteraceae bacterium]|nr:S8 family serine peptidase [Ilumatobacteraceae bacterium]
MNVVHRVISLLVVFIAAGVSCHDITQPITAPFDAHRSFLTSPAGRVVVSPDNMQGWKITDDKTGASCTDASACAVVNGPAGAPAGSGSGELATPAAADAKALVLVDYQGTRLDRVTDLRYFTYRQSTDAGNNIAIALQFNADYDLGDGSVGYQGRLVFEPYQGRGGNVPDTVWQSWDAKAGKWWGTRASVPRSGVLTTNPCVQATPCTWAKLLATFPDVGIHVTYGAIYLKAGSGWLGFRGNVDDLTIGIDGATTTFDFERNVATVPPLPPAGVPDWVYADSNFVSGGTTIAGDLAKNVVMVAFDAGTSAATRTTAVSQVHGAVVGGIPLDDDGDGVYYIRPSTGETPAAVLSAVGTLAAAPGVAMAIPVMHDSVAADYRRPHDGILARSWEIDPANANGENWALESIAAPMAWGCSTGDASTRVAVVDQVFHQVLDVTPTMFEPYTAPYDGARLVENEHGNAVASILAARGNNDLGSTGVMWNSDLRLWDLRRPISDFRGLPDSVVKELGKDGLLRIVARMRAAVRDGARVINVSGGLTLPNRRLIPNDSSGRVYLEARVRPALRWVLSLRKGDSHAPLFVFSAGNGGEDKKGRDASLNGFPIIRQDFPSRVLVVASTHADGSRIYLRDDSNFGDLVDIAAPGDRVMALDQHNDIFGFDGTSAAAPLASGVAGLLVSFDSSLTVNEIRDFLVAGAHLGGQYSSPRNSTQRFPYLNAYEPLKLAAQRAGSPLCGNRVYKSGNAIFAQRGTTTEAIIALDSLTPDSVNTEINVFHGGKRVDLAYHRAFVWKSGSRGFVEQKPYTYSGSLESGGAYRSGVGRDHDNVTGISTIRPPYDAISPMQTSAVSYYTDSLGWIGTTAIVASLPISRPTTASVVGKTPAGGGSPYHYLGYFNPNDSTYVGAWGEPRMDNIDVSAVAMAPSGEYAIVAINFIRRSNSAGSTFLDCTPGAYPDFPPQQCADGTFSALSDSSTLYRVDLRSGAAPRRIANLPGVELEWIALTEREDEIIWQSVIRTESSYVQYLSQTGGGPGPWYFGNVKQVWSSSKSCTGRVLEYRAFDREATVANAVGQLAIPS